MALLGSVIAGRMRPVLSPLLHIRLMSSFAHLTSTVHPVKNRDMFVLVCSTLSPFLKPRDASLCHIRNYAKSKDKKGKDKKIQVHLSDSELSEVVNVTHMREEFSGIVEKLKEDYIKNLSLRTSVGSIENALVKLEGDEYPLNEIAQISRKSSHLLVINAAAFPQALTGIMTALRESGMNLNPQQEGTTIYVALPKVTKEHRENLAKNAKTLYNRCKDHLRDSQNQYVRKSKKKEGQMPDDLVHNAQLKIREIAESYMQEAEKMMMAKQKELLQAN
ncbi:ribosome-recycling factor, mitochondrial [Procambarus clarkii]|uniref:ribosome-recycling factor, mitochondrial n=1 Tax=Procambarus clarkii TaxID=6728 RepID=UPI001E6733CD|nr:ribosome-recycling factor, mitochondrial-like [Procambarus clarkii]XP_045620356.1 ribosome-recycling factor, mitochondrial-like [Procambarus clarkii]